MSRSFPTTTRECAQLLEGINAELKLSIGEELLKAQKAEIQKAQVARERARAEAKEAKPATPSPEDEEAKKKFVYPALGTRLPTHMRRDLR